MTCLIRTLSGSISRYFSSSFNNCMIGSWKAAVKNNFAENKLPWNAEYNLEKAHDPWLNTLKY